MIYSLNPLRDQDIIFKSSPFNLFKGIAFFFFFTLCRATLVQKASRPLFRFRFKQSIEVCYSLLFFANLTVWLSAHYQKNALLQAFFSSYTDASNSVLLSLPFIFKDHFRCHPLFGFSGE